MREPIALADVEILLAEAQHSALRLEQAKIYVLDVHAGALDAWLAGETDPQAGGFDPAHPWFAQVRDQTSRGIRIERVRVFSDPPTPYQVWERWAAATNIAAGERIGYISRPEADQLGVGPDVGDFWLIDGEKLVFYTVDPSTKSETAELVTDPDVVAGALAAFELLACHAVYDSPELAAASAGVS